MCVCEEAMAEEGTKIERESLSQFSYDAFCHPDIFFTTIRILSQNFSNFSHFQAENERQTDRKNVIVGSKP